MADAPAPSTRDQQPRVCFNMCKKELYTPTKGYKSFHRKLKQTCVVDVNREELSLDKLKPYAIVIMGCPQEDLTDAELSALKAYVEGGGSVLLAFGDGHGGRWTYLNTFLEPTLGISLNEDCVVRTVLHKFYHPKEVCVTNGVTNREINRAAGKTVVGASTTMAPPPSAFAAKSANAAMGATAAGATRLGTYAGGGPMMAAGGGTAPAPVEAPSSLSFVYPYGLTFNVQRPAIPLLSSGFMAYPLNRPVAAVWEASEGDDRSSRGKWLVLGSAQVFEDSWIGKEENEKLTTVIIDYLLHRLKLNQIDADEPDITDYHYLPDTASLSERVRVAVEESEELPRDFTKLFDFTTFKLDTGMIPEVMGAYQKLNVKHEPLTLIPPEFQAPLPPRLPATFGPTHREPPAPALDLFDLDEHFAPERVRLAQLTNKCASTDDLEFYIVEGAEITGVTKKLRSPRNKDPRALLDHVFRQILQYKKVNQQGGSGPEGMGASGALVRAFKCSSATDATPFDDATWILSIQINHPRGTVEGNLMFPHSGGGIPAQTVHVEGRVDRANEERPVQWTAVVHTNDGAMTVQFGGILAGHSLRGVCAGPWGQKPFLYHGEEI